MNNYPMYIAIGGPKGITVKFDKLKGKGAIYYRPAGGWYCYVYANSKGYLRCMVPNDNKKVSTFVTTEEHFKEDNQGYI